MNDLDRRIAELKGWNAAAWLAESTMYRDAVPEGHAVVLAQVSWSTSDAKAFELVDELKAEGVGLILMRGPSMDYWYAAFSDSKLIPDAPVVAYERNGESRGATRAEAICRAYIALKDYVAALARMKEKKG